MAKCSECGFLTCREAKSGQLIEIVDFHRRTGKVPAFLSSSGVMNLPICFINIYDLMREAVNIAGTNATAEIDWSPFVSQIITMDRKCPLQSNTLGFVEYQQGFTPKEHREMMDRKFLIELEDNRRKNDRKWHWIELIAIIMGTGLFTLLGAWIANMR